VLCGRFNCNVTSRRRRWRLSGLDPRGKQQREEKGGISMRAFQPPRTLLLQLNSPLQIPFSHFTLLCRLHAPRRSRLIPFTTTQLLPFTIRLNDKWRERERDRERRERERGGVGAGGQPTLFSMCDDPVRFYLKRPSLPPRPLAVKFRYAKSRGRTYSFHQRERERERERESERERERERARKRDTRCCCSELHECEEQRQHPSLKGTFYWATTKGHLAL
jgi:hypothetical protein